MAQESINASAIEIQNAFGAQSVSVGQVFYNIENSISHYCIDGIQQPKLNIVSTTINEQKNENNLVLVYPNPTTDVVFINTKETLEETYYELTDVTGKIITSNNFYTTNESIDFKSYSEGIYYLKIYNSNKKEHAFTIIKNK